MKRFYNNTIMSGALSKALRVLALLCVLLGVSGSAWGATVYFDNTPTNWNSVHVYVKNGTMWDDDNGVTTNGATYYSMSRIGTTNIWKCDVNIAFTHICFMKDKQDNYNNIWQTEAAYYEGYKESTPLLTPKDNNENHNGTKYYNGGSWSAYSEGSGGGDTPSTGGHKGTNVGFWDNEAWNIKVGNTWITQSGYGAEGNTEIDLGTISAGATIGFWTQTWKKKDVSNVCQPRVYVKLTKESTTIRNYDSFELSWNKESESAGSVNQLWLTDNVFSLPTEAGDYQMKVYFEMWGNESSKVGCNQLSYKLNNGEGNYIFNFTIGGGGGGDVDPSDKPASNVIEIWCKGEGGYKDMYCYAWNPDDKTKQPLGGWAGSPKQGEGTYNGEKYAVWVVENYEKLSVIFNNSTDGKTATCQTNDITNLVKGNRYIYTLSENWCSTTPTPVVISSSGTVEEVVNGTFYLDISKFTEWSKEGAIFKAVLTSKTGTVTKDMVQCTSDANIFYINEVLNLDDYTQIQVKRCNPNGGGQWNYSSTLSVSNTATTCVQVTGWDNTGSLVKYSGACGVSADTPVFLGADALVDADGATVTMYGYLAETYCNAITEYGFVYCPGTQTEGCVPNTSSPKLVASSSTQIYRGESFSLRTSALGKGKTYGYRAYVKIGGMIYLSAETGFFRLSDCSTRPVKGNPITYTIDASLGEDYEDDCTLTYGNLQRAIDRLKESYSSSDADYQYVTKVGDSYNLNQPVTMKVKFYNDDMSTDAAYIYRGTTNVGKHAGAATPKNANLLQDINRSATNKANTLTIKAGDNKAKPWVHHIVIRNSKNIVLDSLAIFSDPADTDASKDGVQTIGDNALELDKDIASGDANWHTLNTNGYVDDANILIQNCMIGSDGFTGAHISSYDGVTFKNNDIESVFDNGTSNSIAWGASFKFMFCKNIKFIQNNFRGDHATLLWMQEVQNMLVMNNVFWNTNKFLAGANDRNPAAMRLVTQWDVVKNVGFYYNTYYFANNNVDSKSTYDFMAFAEAANITVSTLQFKYNNCYSYDLDCPGKSSNPFLGKDVSGDNFCPNNFWSEYDVKNSKNPSVFAFGCNNNEFIDVSNAVCATTASGPASLMIKNDDLNYGIKPDISITNLTLTEEEMYSDRYLKNQRPTTDTEWTYGAYQSKKGVDVNKIYWVGLTEDWDDRNNWEYEVEDDKTRAVVRQRLSCVNVLENDLTAVIEEKGSVEIAGGRKWPRIPANFEENRSNMADNEHVSAGLGADEPVSDLFAKTIIVEAGAAIKGIEHLKNGKLHYKNAITHLDAPRSKWVLVGGVVQPFNEEGEPSDLLSGHFFKNYLPQVYMHQAEITGGNATWGNTFPDLYTRVLPGTVFAINIPDEYGEFKLPARYYNPYFGGNFDPNAPVSYEFNGRFADESAMRTYSDLTEGTPVLLNNTYPCNLDARLVEKISGGTVLFYNYEAATFMSTASTASTVLLKPQHGFIFIPGAGQNSLTITDDMLADGYTHSRDAEATVPTLSLNLYNANTQKGFSNVALHYDSEVDVTNGSATDIEKVFAPNADSPELYIMANDKQYTRYTAGNQMLTIPLGIRLQMDMNVKFERVYAEGIDYATLVDSYTGQEIDLLRNAHTTEVLLADTIEGRYFLNIVLSTEPEFIPDEDVPTDIEQEQEEGNSISIYIDEANGSVINVLGNGVELQTIYVSDMTGRTMQYNVTGSYVSLNLPVAQGVYMVQVIGDNATRTEKVILK